MRECYSCGSIKTYVRKDGQQQWYRNRPFEQWFCENCNNKFVKNPIWKPITDPIWNPRHMYFRDKIIILDRNPRTGYCSKCSNNIFNGTCKKTDIHHIEYHEEDPLKDTVELCVSCHAKERLNGHRK